MKITLAGMGPGSGGLLTADAHRTLREAEAVLGAPRLLEGLPPDVAGEKIAAATPDKVAAAIAQNPGWQKACVALSGDVGFYSGARRLLELLAGHEMALVCGISTPQVLAARLGRPWQGFHLVSGHGVACNVLAEVLNHQETFFLTGGDLTAQGLCQTLCEAGLAEARVWVGENLSAPDERLVQGTAGELAQQSFASLCAVLVENEKTFARRAVSGGIADEQFIRGEAPMTKREVRAMALSLLEIEPGDVLYDVGAGTGSVAVEMALLARRGRVYAVESEEAACRLALANREKFGVYNLQVLQGRAPEALADLPAPDAVFVGGSKGRMEPVLRLAMEKNPQARLVVSAIALETLNAAMKILKKLGAADIEVCQIAASRALARGSYHMLTAQNPVFLISAGGRGHG